MVPRVVHCYGFTSLNWHRGRAAHHRPSERIADFIENMFALFSFPGWPMHRSSKYILFVLRIFFWQVRGYRVLDPHPLITNLFGVCRQRQTMNCRYITSAPNFAMEAEISFPRCENILQERPLPAYRYRTTSQDVYSGVFDSCQISPICSSICVH